MRCIETRDGPLDERAEALDAVAVLLEGVVREQLDDAELAGSLDGLSKRTVVCDETTLNVTGAFYTLGWRAAGGRGDPMLPMDAVLSTEPGAVSVVRVAGRESLFETPESERAFQRAFAAATWHTFELRLG